MLKPCTDGRENVRLFLRKRSVRFRPDIQKERSVLRVDVDQVAQNVLCLLIPVFGCVAPGIEAHRRIALPPERLLPGELPPLDIGNRGPERKGVMLVIDDNLLPSLRGPVIVICRQRLQIRTQLHPLDPPVKIKDCRLILINQLTGPHQPVLHEFLGRRSFPVDRVKVGRPFYGRPVEIAPLERTLDIAVKFPPFSQEEAVFDPVRRHAKDKARLLHAFFQIADDVPFRTHIRGIVGGEAALIHLKAVMMLGDRNDVLRAGISKNLHPSVRVKTLRAEHRNKVLQAELRMRAIGFQMVLICLAVLHIHHAGIPFTVIRGNGKQPVMNKDPEPHPLIPLRHFVSGQRLPVIRIRPLADHILNLPQLLLKIVILQFSHPPCFRLIMAVNADGVYVYRNH